MNSSNSIVQKLVKAEEDLKHLQTSQFIGDDNLSYFEYVAPDMNLTLNTSDMRFFVIVFYSEYGLPLVSCEYSIYEDGVLRPYPRGSAAPYGNAVNSTCMYEMMDGLGVLPRTQGASGVRLNGATYQFSDPKVNQYMIVPSRLSTTTSTAIRIGNIKIKSTSSGIVHTGVCTINDFVY